MLCRSTMVSLEPCRKSYGYARLIPGRPAIEVHKNVVFDGNGLYDRKGRLIPNAAYFSGVAFPHRRPDEPWSEHTSRLNPASSLDRLALPGLIWGGLLIGHYGHFLLDTLSRLWVLRAALTAKSKIVFWLAGHTLEFCLSIEAVATCLALLGLDRENIVILSHPTMIDEISIPETAFAINDYAYEEYRAFTGFLADKLCGTGNPTNSTPVYITKAGLSSGTARIANEAQFVDRLQRAGIDIFYPERHTLKEQIGLWRERPMIAGYLGSAMHTAIFAEKRRLLIMNHEPQIYSNQVLIDALCEHRSTYVYPAGIIRGSADDSFGLNFIIPNPLRTAEAFLRLLDSDIRERTRSFLPPSTVDTQLYIDEPLGRNLSLHKPSQQSSVFPPHSQGGDTASDAGRAVNGVLLEHYAFHTAMQTHPWWRVDLERVCDIQEVRIFNRIDIGREHFRSFRICSSLDDEHWIEQDRRISDQPFGDGDVPYRWLPQQPVQARYIRLQALNQAYLHLKQVEVFGDECLLSE